MRLNNRRCIVLRKTQSCGLFWYDPSTASQLIHQGQMEQARMSPSHHPADVLPPVKTPFKFMLTHAVTVRRTEHGVQAALAWTTTAPAHGLSRSGLKVSEVEGKNNERKEKETADQNNPAGFFFFWQEVRVAGLAPSCLNKELVAHCGCDCTAEFTLITATILINCKGSQFYEKKPLWPQALIEENCGNPICVALEHGGRD